jgi:hypothetical protein
VRCAVKAAPLARASRPGKTLVCVTGGTRMVGPDDVAALAVHVMANTALTGATYDIDGGQPLLSRGV